ncbi:MAG: Na(+)/H(+) antiporter subunit D [Rhodospirillaceae bacterium]|jgi:multicomponent Na+:H+ antiporter subunit D|nr:Na(+)/H(+) antiporter subunit D [Rhodospirillaceae bacterium]MBT4770851.1 Na(+)/H(+) antiporter subunit D [Rhodospirillaceae bacterium]MBT5359856.1 Na(+)/H(+) antiporter subunit D [Rhodospirillaceae bacterium]MBT5769561.1 Na(+)/H(+) antiporter subunit D [Rhodospirillaceae bacterium]MBT6308512.1 Na(+)/H(+) antiporter subunit D [Rhodospirillaceae bacterium]
MIEFPPGLLLILGALPVPFLRGPLRGIWMLALPVAAFALLYSLPDGNHFPISAFGQELELLRVDALSRVFGYVFIIAIFLGVIYSLHVRAVEEHVSGLIYAGAAIGAVFVGDLVSLFVYWELTAIASVFLILARRTPEALAASMRYLIIQVGSGVLLLAGLIVRWHETGSIEFGHIGIDGAGGVLILLAFGIKAAFPLLHNWLQDAYPQATPTGTVLLSAFTTKLAIYALARGYAGTEELIWIGVTMTAFPIFFAVIENDLRKVLAYSLNNQLGFMVVGVGIGTELALNGAAAHAFTHIIYKSLLFMSMGAVLHRTGTVLATELGGLYKSMPFTTVFCIIGGASISAFPLFSGFVSKSMILSAAAHEEYYFTWLVLLFASAGVFHHSGIKIPFFAFFAHDSGKRPKEAPLNMLIAMGLASILCIGIGVWPSALYAILPFDVDFRPYTDSHVLAQVQLLFFSALAFTVLIRTGLYPPELRCTNLDTDWLYRRLGRRLLVRITSAAGAVQARFYGALNRRGQRFLLQLYRHHGPQGVLARTWPTGSMVLWVALLLFAYLFLYFLDIF